MHRFLVLGATLVLALALSGIAEAWSWPADGQVLRTFELGSDAYAAGQHRGIDVAGAPGSPVRAPAAGTVTFAGSVPNHGRGVTILTADGYSVTLFHLESFEVVKGDAVAEGATVGTMGSSGDAEHSVPTVHFGLRVADRPDGYVDPLGLLPERPAQQPAPPPAATVPAPMAGAAPAPIAPPPPPVQSAAPTPPATPVPPPPAAASAPPAAVTPPATPPVVVSPPAVTPHAPEPIRISEPVVAPSADASPSETAVGASPTSAPPGVDVVAGASHPVRSALSGLAVATPERVGPTSAGAARPADVGGAERSATRLGDPASATTIRATLVEPASGRSAHGGGVRSAVQSEAGRGAVRPLVRDDRALTPVARVSQPANQRSREAPPLGGARPVLGELARGPGSLPASVEVHGPGTGLGLAELLAALTVLALVAARIVVRVARRIGSDEALLPDDADLLRQLDAAHRPRVHDGRGRRVRASSAAARP